ncbi:hypothetical protein, unlikely [Trypanosoma brucei brucei TREU927]|uniref:Uncharacterized protein n=2 Tax=Trypanosoma brucei TaxID=5691 RepID=Q4GZA7_TRYB2|nr:hypothetical protein, unlikely [Trypanosoma brucei brucei TREU927]RHW74399.1 hypothetical protein DPX39_010014600 [Trypanosoma brucei equiperdum]CAJ16049.1 hypothetical protein, unlikely [Trypanosoma brucei brucei TREU927]
MCSRSRMWRHMIAPECAVVKAGLRHLFLLLFFRSPNLWTILVRYCTWVPWISTKC